MAETKLRNHIIPIGKPDIYYSGLSNFFGECTVAFENNPRQISYGYLGNRLRLRYSEPI